MSKLLFTMLLCTIPAAARSEHRHAPEALPAALLDGRECTCRSLGRVYAMGEEICMATPEGRQLARCGMVINMPSWSVTPQSCEPPTQ